MTPSILTSTVIVAGFVFLAIFTALYGALAPWYRSPAGRALMVMSTGFLLVLLALMLRHPFGWSTRNSAFFGWFQATAIGVSCCGTGWITLVLVRAQRRGRYFEEDRTQLHARKKDGP